MFYYKGIYNECYKWRIRKKIENRYKLIEEGLKDLISNITEMLGMLESAKYLEFIKRKIKEETN